MLWTGDYVSIPEFEIRPAQSGDAARLEAIRGAAFAPVFASFRSILGDEIYDIAQAREDNAQKDLLLSLLTGESTWEMHVASVADEGRHGSYGWRPKPCSRAAGVPKGRILSRDPQRMDVSVVEVEVSS